MKVPPCFEDAEARRIIRRICDENRVDDTLLKDLCEIALEHSGSAKRFGIDDQIADAVSRFIERNKED